MSAHAQDTRHGCNALHIKAATRASSCTREGKRVALLTETWRRGTAPERRRAAKEEMTERKRRRDDREHVCVCVCAHRSALRHACSERRGASCARAARERRPRGPRAAPERHVGRGAAHERNDGQERGDRKHWPDTSAPRADSLGDPHCVGRRGREWWVRSPPGVRGTRRRRGATGKANSKHNRDPPKVACVILVVLGARERQFGKRNLVGWATLDANKRI